MAQTSFPILCEFWQEDGVWNGTAEHLAVAVFGSTYEEAQKNLKDALIAHLQCWMQAGKQNELLELLQQQASEQIQVSEIQPSHSLVNMPMMLSDNEVVSFHL